MQRIASDMNKSKRESFLQLSQGANHLGNFIGDKLQGDVQRWLSSPDPWKNHNMACRSRHAGTATWFVHGKAFSEWKSSRTSSLLWVHGKRPWSF
jgi:hypothetical protein